MILVPLIRYSAAMSRPSARCETFNGVLATKTRQPRAAKWFLTPFLQPRMTASQQALPNWLEQFDWVAVGIFNLDLSATWSRFHLVTEMDSSLF